jgi:hypothetical protein
LDTAVSLPVDLREWWPEDELVWRVLDVALTVAQIGVMFGARDGLSSKGEGSPGFGTRR